MLKVQRKVLVQRRGIFEQACSRARFAVPESRHAHANRSGTGDGVRSLSQIATVERSVRAQGHNQNLTIAAE